MAAAAAVVAAATLAACGSSDGGPGSSGPSTAGGSSAAPGSSSGSFADGYGIPEGASPLSGRTDGAGKPVLIVKVDNTGWAQPHEGLTAADLIYIEPVEWGLNRIAAVFSSQLPSRVGPVRSARISDIDLIAQFDRPAFAFSGAQAKLLPLLAEAPFYDVSGLLDGAGYTIDSTRKSPYNAFIDPSVLLNQRAPEASIAKDIGFVFSDAPPAGGSAASAVRVKWYGSQVDFNWSVDSNDYVVSFNGKPARAVESSTGQHAATVVIQYVDQKDSEFGDMYGGKTPVVSSVGTGEAVVLRDGQMWETTWTRATPQEGTVFTRADGSRMPFDIGQIWIVLYENDKEARITP
jgi:hypothetical protein